MDGVKARNPASEFQKRRAEATQLRRAKLDHPIHAELKIKCGGKRQVEAIMGLLVASVIGVWK